MRARIKLERDQEPQDGHSYLVRRDHGRGWEILTAVGDKWRGHKDAPDVSIDLACDEWFRLP